MHPQLEILLQIQDLKTQRRELAETERERQVEELEFHVNVEEAVQELDHKIAEMEAQLTPAIRNRYARIASGRGRAVVPVIQGICYGCFVSIPTALATDSARNDQIRHCDHCGRFLYVIG
ncbi:MAG: hypothetical protein HY561_13090 [Gemmatimonadetes bacterium]|nr:hypothetical protein [Gemmatimonadota bacterium]